MSEARRRGRVGLVVAVPVILFAVAGSLAGCTSADPAGPPPTRPTHPNPPPRSRTIAPPTTAPTTTAPTHRPKPTATTPAAPTPTLSSSVASTTPPAPSSAPAPTTSAPPAPVSTCPHVSIRVIRGGATQGTEIAALDFTNTGQSRCTLAGYARAVLLRNGARIGSPSQPAGPLPGPVVPIAPGQTLQALLRDYSGCQAPLSDAVRVFVPGSTIHAARPAQLRACRLRVGKLTQPG